MGQLDFLYDDDTAVDYLKTLTDTVRNKPTGSNNVWFRYRNLDYNQSCTVRFLPASPENASGPFWLPKKLIRLKFADPVSVGKDVNIAIPVMQMYVGGKPSDDPILGQVTRLYEQAKALDAKGETEKGKQVRAKASYHYIRGESIAQGFVITPGFIEQDPPENPIRLFELNKQIIKVITRKIDTEDPDLKLDFWPCHGKKGHNFVIHKARTGDGKFPKWDDGTGFSSKVSPHTELQKAAVEQYGLWTLENFLPARPGVEEYQMLTEIVRLSIDGNRMWNPDWEAHLNAVKVYRTAQSGDDEVTTFQEQVHDQLARMPGGSAATQTAEVLSVLGARTASNHQDVETDVEPETEVVDMGELGGDTEPVAARSGPDVKGMVDKIKRQQIKTATADD